ncbi:MAG: hypothetical protein IJW64_04240 [Clostridia bacterium]|nr:hypothetical protein [Clostridia bacterium]
MSLFENFVYKNGEIVDNSWVEWKHNNVPDEESERRNRIRARLAELRHCEECTALSGCYFVKTLLPKKKDDGKGLLHKNCHCYLIKRVKPKLSALCDIRKFENYVFSDKYKDNGKIQLFKTLGFEKSDTGFLKREFELQAKRKYESGDYTLGKLDRYGQRINITVIITSKNERQVEFVSGWMIHPLGLITCNTPLGG